MEPAILFLYNQDARSAPSSKPASPFLPKQQTRVKLDRTVAFHTYSASLRSGAFSVK